MGHFWDTKFRVSIPSQKHPPFLCSKRHPSSGHFTPRMPRRGRLTPKRVCMLAYTMAPGACEPAPVTKWQSVGSFRKACTKAAVFLHHAFPPPPVGVPFRCPGCPHARGQSLFSHCSVPAAAPTPPPNGVPKVSHGVPACVILFPRITEQNPQNPGKAGQITSVCCRDSGFSALSATRARGSEIGLA